MVTSPSPSPAGLQRTTSPGFVAADVGGTHVRIGHVRRADAAGGLEVLDYRKYVCADHAGLAEILEDYLAGLPDARIRNGVIACAGHAAADGSVISANLPWPVVPARIQQRLGFDDFRLVNDFEAVAYAAGRVDANELLHLSGPRRAAAGPSLVVGPGTGLGAAVRIPTRNGAVVLATEAGQAGLTPGTAEEMAVKALLLADRSHVPIEHVLSGPGLLHLYRALGRLRDTPAPLDSPGAISAAAQAGGDPLARAALDLFCGLLGSTIGDMALLYGAHGGIYLAGGILPQIRGFLLGSRFVARFLDKGPMREILEGIPVKLVEHGQLGVLGAASWYQAQHEDG